MRLVGLNANSVRARWLVVVAAVVVAHATTLAVPIAAQPGVEVRRDVLYGAVAGEQLFLDVYLPASHGRRRPAVVLVHGGGWAIGDKAGFADEGRRLAALGYVAFSVNYRLAPRDPYPAAVDDVQAAVRWVRAHKQVKAYGVDPKRIGAIGASAGGHLVGMLATLGSGRLDRGARVRAAVSWSGPMDFTPLNNVVGTAPVSLEEVAKAVLDFLGCTDIDAACARTANEASPITHLDASDAPLLLVNASNEVVPVGQAQRMDAALARVGVAHRLIVVPGSAHADELAPAVWNDTVRFLEQYLGPPAT